jgi:hypothetical protein
MYLPKLKVIIEELASRLYSSRDYRSHGEVYSVARQQDLLLDLTLYLQDINNYKYYHTLEKFRFAISASMDRIIFLAYE